MKERGVAYTQNTGFSDGPGDQGLHSCPHEFTEAKDGNMPKTRQLWSRKWLFKTGHGLRWLSNKLLPTSLFATFPLPPRTELFPNVTVKRRFSIVNCVSHINAALILTWPYLLPRLIHSENLGKQMLILLPFAANIRCQFWQICKW